MHATTPQNINTTYVALEPITANIFQLNGTILSVKFVNPQAR